MVASGPSIKAEDDLGFVDRRQVAVGNTWAVAYGVEAKESSEPWCC